MSWLIYALAAGQTVCLIGLLISFARQRNASKMHSQAMEKLVQRLTTAEQMQSLLARAHKTVLIRAQSQVKTPEQISPEAIYEQANQLIAKGCEAAELSRSLNLPLEEAEIMVQLGRLKQTA